jgi:hypothetical protein
MLTDDDVWLDAAQERFDRVWSGRECKGCKLRGVCPAPIDTTYARAPQGRPASAAKPGSAAKLTKPRRPRKVTPSKA